MTISRGICICPSGCSRDARLCLSAVSWPTRSKVTYLSGSGDTNGSFRLCCYERERSWVLRFEITVELWVLMQDTEHDGEEVVVPMMCSEPRGGFIWVLSLYYQYFKFLFKWFVRC